MKLYKTNACEFQPFKYILSLILIILSMQTVTLQAQVSSDTVYTDSTKVELETILTGNDPGMNVKEPRWAIKTNLLMDVTTTISIATELRMGTKKTIDLSFLLNPWIFENNRQWRLFLVQPELRWWGNEVFNGYYIGVNTMYAVYNIGNLDLPLGLYSALKEYRYEGHLFGGGVSVGQQWILSDRLNLELNAGIGYFYTDYTKKRCTECGAFVANGSNHYWGITKVGVSLVYMLK